jgi:hypothetical protein
LSETHEHPPERDISRAALQERLVQLLQERDRFIVGANIQIQNEERELAPYRARLAELDALKEALPVRIATYNAAINELGNALTLPVSEPEQGVGDGKEAGAAKAAKVGRGAKAPRAKATQEQVNGNP